MATARDPLDAQLDALAAAQERPEDDVRAARAALARAALAAALFLGVLADALFRDGPVGIAFPLWIAVCLAVAVALAWRRSDRLRAEQALWMLGALYFAAQIAWRDEETIQFFSLLAVVACLVMLGMTLAGTPAPSILAARVRDLLLAAGRTIADGLTGVVPLVLHDADWGELGAKLPRHQALPVVRAVLITLPLVVLFGALLRSADPLFAARLSLPALDVERIASHVLLVGFFTWITAGWMRGALVSPRLPASTAETRLLGLGVLEVTMVLGTLAALFAAFVGVQLEWLFGGEALVRRTTGLGYAQYARRGFFELMWVALLSVPVLLGLHAAVPETDARARRRLRILGVLLVVLLGAVLASAAGRMALYVRYYGLSVDRVYASAAMAWVALVLAWLVVTVLRDRPTRFAAGMALGALAVLGVVAVANPAALVARTNLKRGPVLVTSASGGTPVRAVDYFYLARLGADAVPALAPALLVPAPRAEPEVAARGRCVAASVLLHDWADTRAGDWEEWDWRRWHAARSRARHVVRAHEGELRRVAAGEACRRKKA